MTRTSRLLPALLFFIGLCGLAAPAPAQTTIAGDWDLTITSPQGTRTAPISLKQDGEKITGAFKSQAGELPVDGTLTGNAFKLAAADHDERHGGRRVDYRQGGLRRVRRG